jgi:hypothetical protein
MPLTRGPNESLVNDLRMTSTVPVRPGLWSQPPRRDRRLRDFGIHPPDMLERAPLQDRAEAAQIFS